MATKRTRKPARKSTRTAKPKKARRRRPAFKVDARRLAKKIFDRAMAGDTDSAAWLLHEHMRCPGQPHLNCRCSVDPEIDDNCCRCDAGAAEHAYHATRRASEAVKLVTWTTRDGREIAIRDMEDMHLVNTVAMLYRRAGSYRLGLELLNNVKGAEEELGDTEFLYRYHPQFQAMTSELERRGLERSLAQLET